jgi:hypothetical protein
MTTPDRLVRPADLDGQRLTKRDDGLYARLARLPDTHPSSDRYLDGLELADQARGTSSGREHNADAAGGPIQQLDARTAVIDRKGVADVAAHLERFVAEGVLEAPERGMLSRLSAIAADEMEPTRYDLNFYTHEQREAERYEQLGYGSEADLGASDMYDVWNNVHTAALEDYGISDRDLYHPDVAP